MPEPLPTYPDRLEIIPLARPIDALVPVPGSKSITNRALVLAALTCPDKQHGTCDVVGALRSEDTEVMIDSLRRLGFEVETDWSKNTVRVSRLPGEPAI